MSPREEQAHQPVVCDSCGRLNVGVQKHCLVCGRRLPAAEPPAPPLGRPEYDPPRPSTPPESRRSAPPPPPELEEERRPPPPPERAPMAPAPPTAPSWGPGEAIAPQEYVGIGPRFVAQIVDGVLISVAMAIVSVPLLLATAGIDSAPIEVSPGTQELGGLQIFSMLAFWALALLLPLAYFTVFEAYGWTPGKRLLGLRIETAAGNAPGWGKSLVRNLLRPVDAIPSGYLVGAILVWTSDKKQRLGDRGAGTYVVRR